ncbi:MAG: transcription termination/antitermination protein NusG [Endomicrobiia bacterium]
MIEESNKEETLTSNQIRDINSGWYIVYCQVGKEIVAKNLIEEKIKSTPGIENKIFEVLVPEEEEIQIRKGEKNIVRKATYNGYIYINMILDAETYWFIRNITWVKGFLGGANPQKMSQQEVEGIKILSERMKQSQPKLVRKFDIGDTVRIIEGPFKHFTGVVEEINEEKAKLKVTITVFGRPTPVELDFPQVEKV